MSKWLVLIIGSLLSLALSAQEIEFSRADIQAELEKRLPITHQQGVVAITLAKPKLDLMADEQRLKIRVQIIVATVIGGEMRGFVTANGKLRYKNLNHSFYIDNPKIDELSVEGIPDDVQLQLKLIAQQMLVPALSDQPVYQLKDNNVQEALAKMMLQSITIKDDAIVASLSLF
ncbi:MAG: hypothetical protein RL217_78 [Pseudomonadota bacterium]|jgi:hypothetical protein